MSLAPLLSAPLAVQIHVVTVVIAIALTPLMLWGPKGTTLHRVTGRTWVVAMAVTALSSLAISSHFVPIHFGPIHILSVVVLSSLWMAISAARRGHIAKHRKIMRQLAFWSLLVTGAFTLIPGRMMFDVVTGG